MAVWFCAKASLCGRRPLCSLMAAWFCAKASLCGRRPLCSLMAVYLGMKEGDKRTMGSDNFFEVEKTIGKTGFDSQSFPSKLKLFHSISLSCSQSCGAHCWVYKSFGLALSSLAQASESSLSESIRKSTQVLRELSLKRRVPVLSESPSRSGEEVSPKREDALANFPLFSSPRLDEGGSPKRETLSPERDFSA
ncbi:hypothetical protein DEO72_LG10g2456 [Vigna unguiculata]|uniref:Uncharacterized protein n=1 Tax=Vigna unguiculata TaxID=3917 RepID=A0A4D6NBL0_VIGUN|nr:hypothetical protein DEO72_LG10g2456 [Vigna unguiculata]